MPTTVKLLALVNSAGRVLAAHFEDQSTISNSKDTPTSGFVPLDGQRAITIDVPREALELPGPDFHRFLSHVKITWPAVVQVPEIKVVRKHKQ